MLILNTDANADASRAYHRPLDVHFYTDIHLVFCIFLVHCLLHGVWCIVNGVQYTAHDTRRGVDDDDECKSVRHF